MTPRPGRAPHLPRPQVGRAASGPRQRGASVPAGRVAEREQSCRGRQPDPPARRVSPLLRLRGHGQRERGGRQAARAWGPRGQLAPDQAAAMRRARQLPAGAWSAEQHPVVESLQTYEARVAAGHRRSARAPQVSPSPLKTTMRDQPPAGRDPLAVEAHLPRRVSSCRMRPPRSRKGRAQAIERCRACGSRKCPNPARTPRYPGACGACMKPLPWWGALRGVRRAPAAEVSGSPISRVMQSVI